MKKVTFIGLLFILAVGMGAVQKTLAAPVTKAERKAAIKYLKETRKMFLNSVKGLSEEQLKWKAAPERWSVFEVAEHITLAESFLFGMISGQIMKSPADKTKTSVITMEQIIKTITDRSQKFQAPEPLQPSKATWSNIAETVKAFKERRETTIDFIEDGGDDMREHFAPNPLFKDMDAYLWIVFLSAHTERHVKQILEVKSNPNFPKKKSSY